MTGVLVAVWRNFHFKTKRYIRNIKDLVSRNLLSKMSQFVLNSLLSFYDTGLFVNNVNIFLHFLDLSSCRLGKKKTSQMSASNFLASSHECVDVNFNDCASICSTLSSNKSVHVQIQESNPGTHMDDIDPNLSW